MDGRIGGVLVPELQLVDAARNPYLSGRFAPVHREIETSDLTVEGDLPADLAGAYVRNGPNAKFPTLGSYTYPMEGDGMLHGVWFEPGAVRYKNRWVRTRGLEAEERAGRALFGGLMTPAMVDQSLLGPDPDPGWPTKLDAFINIVRHAGRYLALEEALPAYEVTAELETVGRYDFGGALARGITAHPKIDPVTGEMVVFRYDLEQPYLTWAVVGAGGRVTQPETVVDGVERGYMIHDFAITERHLLLALGPAVFDLEAMMQGGPLLAWRPELGMRIAVIPRDGSSGPCWVETDACWVWHFADACEQGDTIELDFPLWNVPGFLVPETRVTCDYVRAEINPARGTIDLARLHEAHADFPRVDDRLVGRAHRYTVLNASSGSDALTPGELDLLCRVDLETGAWSEFAPGGVLGEPVFAPRPGGVDELDGWYLAFVTSFADDHTSLCVCDASEFPAPPRARVHLPQRVPNGLHGSWFPAS